MNRISQCFADLREQGRKALVGYIVAGDPQADCTVEAMHALVDGGVDVIELGVPFTDPEAEGPVIQLAHQRALEHGMSLAGTLQVVDRFRQRDSTTPVLLMGYLNPIERMGYRQFADAAVAAGVDGTIIVNLPPEEAAPLTEPMRAAGLDAVFLLAPTTTGERARSVAAASSGFVYYVSLTGVTGADSLDVEQVRERVGSLRPLLGGLPLVVGFGIKDGATAAAMAAFADGVVVGSAFVKEFARHAGEPHNIAAALAGLGAEIRAALDRLPAASTGKS